MDSDIHKTLAEHERLLKQSLDLHRENNKIIKKIHTHLKRRALFRTIYWILIIGLMVGAYLFSMPYIKRIAEGYQNIQNSIQQTSETLQNPFGEGSFLGNWFGGNANPEEEVSE